MQDQPISSLHSDRLPGGTITFLFTDIEGSTEMLKALGDGYTQVLADQRQILRLAFERWHGHEVDTQGDAFFFGFASARDAVAAALEAQQAIANHSWPNGQQLRVRMGLHTGEAIVTDEGYVGLDVHRTARICSAGHGGQVLLSPSTCALVQNDLPEGIRLLDLGEHRLKDLRHAVRLNQLVAPGLKREFPPLKTLNALPNNLPVQLTSFVGRQQEIDQLKELLEQGRLVTLCGPGGVGKSRLSQQLAAYFVDQFPHGVWYVELETLDSAKEIAPAIAHVLQYHIDAHSSDLSPEKQVLDYLSKRSLLLVLDNFEHLLDGVGLLTNILTHASQVKLLITSRERLNVPGEWAYDLSGMEYPSNGSSQEPNGYSALTLFIERARHTSPGFNLTEHDRPHANRICRLVGGMPLGIELAAPWTAMLTCEEIAEEIEQNIDFLGDTLRGLPEGHRSVRAVFQHSWRLLDEDQREAFRKLSIFQGGFDRVAAQQVAGTRLNVLMDLANKSLVMRSESGRFHMHALLHQFAAEQLGMNQIEQSDVQERHSRHYIQWLESWVASLPERDYMAAREFALQESSNVRAAMQLLLLHWSETEALRALETANQFYYALGYFESSNAYEWLSDYLKKQGANLTPGDKFRPLLLHTLVNQAEIPASLGDEDVEAQARQYLEILRSLDLKIELAVCLYVIGICLEARAAYNEAIDLLEEATALYRETGSYSRLPSCLMWLGWAYSESGDFRKSKDIFTEAYQVSRQYGLGFDVPYSLSKLGTSADSIGDYEKGLSYHQEALASFEQLGDQAGQGYALTRMSLSAWGLGDFLAAEQYGRAGLERFNSLSHRWGIATGLCRLGFAVLGQGKLDEADELFRQGIQRSVEYGYRSTAMYALIGLGVVWSQRGGEHKAAIVLHFCLENPATPAIYKTIARQVLAQISLKLSQTELEEAKRAAGGLDFDSLVNEFIA